MITTGTLPVCTTCLAPIVFATYVGGAPYCRVCSADMKEAVVRKREVWRERKPNRRRRR